MSRAAIAFILLTSAPQAVLAAPTRHIDVAVAAPGVSDALLNGIFSEAGAIWGPADVAFHWHRLSEADGTRHDYLLLTFDRSTVTGSQAPLGWITFEMGRSGHAIHLAAGNAESLIHRTPSVHDTTMGEHEALLGRALGRAFAHEAGHYLLNSKAHASNGLMRAAWPAEQFLSGDRQPFALDADEQSAARWIPKTYSSGREQ